MTYTIQTEQGKYYTIDENDNITTRNWPVPSGSWKCLGLCKALAFGRIGWCQMLEEVLAQHPDGNLRFKNGRGKFYLRDYDHGIVRTWTDRVVAIWCNGEES